ncbi:protein kinase domain-containing protein, partial [Morganella morganii]|uniref:protein kinase domain-containing protein n=1 Tax=Morganella morganii TaxID=582 RepID=UPI003F72E3B7
MANGMGKALAYAHERGFVHCDLKPANVFLTDRNEVKVIDPAVAGLQGHAVRQGMAYRERHGQGACLCARAGFRALRPEACER